MTKKEYILYKYAALDRDLALDYSEDPVIQDTNPVPTNGLYNDRLDRVNNEMNRRMLRDDRARLNAEIERQRAKRNPLNWFTNMFRKKQPQPQQQIRPEEYTPLPADAWHLGGFGM